VFSNYVCRRVEEKKDGRYKLNSIHSNSVIAVKNKVDVIVAGRGA